MVTYEDLGSRWAVYVVDCGSNIDNVVGGDMMKPYNGHRSWNAWNVALWIGDDEQQYNWAMQCLERTYRNLQRATQLFMTAYGGTKTPDGATYNRLSVKLALEGLMED